MKRQTKILRRRIRRVNRSAAKIFGTAARPRLCVFRSNRHIQVQLIDDDKSHTVASVSSYASGKSKSETKSAQASALGTRIAEKAKALHIAAAVLDRRSYKYHGRVKALAEAARAAGLRI